MLDTLEPRSPDALLALIKQFADDDRSDKIDLGVGVYRTNEGDTPVFAAIKAAEKRLLAEQESKAYLGPEGDMGFVHALMPRIFGRDATHHGRVEGMQTPGGTGAVRLAAALAKAAGVRRVLMGVPSWPNHAQIFDDLGLETAPFDHARADGAADVEALLEALEGATPSDVVLLHASCHNPTGVDYTPADWSRIVDALEERGILPIVDCAYQGLGEGLKEDVAGLRMIADRLPAALFAYSCDKNFGMYRDRVGALYAMTARKDGLEAVLSNAAALARASWSMPPDHGAAAVRIVLRDAALTEAWEEELGTMRTRLNAVRARLDRAGMAGAINLTPLGRGNGMFAMLPLSREQIDALKREHGIYMAGSGRINVAGLHRGNTDKFVAALSDVSA